MPTPVDFSMEIFLDVFFQAFIAIFPSSMGHGIGYIRESPNHKNTEIPSDLADQWWLVGAFLLVIYNVGPPNCKLDYKPDQL